MSTEGKETFIVATLPPDVETPAYARKLLRKYRDNDLGKRIALEYRWYNAWFDSSALLAIADLPWRRGSSSDFWTLVIRARDVPRAVSECKRVYSDLDALASAILAAVDYDDEVDDGEEAKELPAFLEDTTSLVEPMDADTAARRVAQVFAAVVRTLRRAEKRERGIIVVHELHE